MRFSVTEELERIKEKGLFRSTRLVRGRQSARVTLNEREVLLLCSNNYLGLAEHPDLVSAAIRAAEDFGVSSGASRLVSGTMELHEALELAVADFKRTESALIFNSGYAANTGVIPALVGRGDIIFCDRLNHASIIDGAILSGAKLMRYPHNDHVVLATIMEKHRGSGRCLIVTDGVFSMDGDLAPLRELAELKSRFGALLMVDDAHGCGVMGREGRGAADVMEAASSIDIHIGTFGKALGSFGAYAALSCELRDLLMNRARSFIFSTSLPPTVLAVSLAALKLVRSEAGDTLREKLSSNAIFFRQLIRNSGFRTGDSLTQIVPLFIGEAEQAMRFSETLLQEGIYAQGIRPPSVPQGSCRLRCTLMAAHSQSDLAWAAERIEAIGRRMGIV